MEATHIELIVQYADIEKVLRDLKVEINQLMHMDVVIDSYNYSIIEHMSKQDPTLPHRQVMQNVRNHVFQLKLREILTSLFEIKMAIREHTERIQWSSQIAP